ARRHEGELRHPVERRELALVKMVGRPVVLDLRHHLAGQQFRRHQRRLPDAAASLGQRIPVGLGPQAYGRNNARPGDDAATRSAHEACCFWATRPSMAFTTSPTVAKSVAALLAL